MPKIKPYLSEVKTTKSEFDNVPAWQILYQRLKLNNINNVTSYQVNGNLFIVIPIEEK